MVETKQCLALNNNFLLSDDLTLLHVGSVLQHLLGYSHDYLNDKSVEVLKPKQNLRLIFEQKTFYQSELEVCNASGIYVHLLISGYVKEECTEYHSKIAVVFFHDISLQAKYEALYLGKEIELNALIYKISHDLRGPVASLKGLLQLQKIERDFSRHSEHLEWMFSTLDTLDDKVRELTELASISTGSENILSETTLHKIIYQSLNDCYKRFDLLETIFNFNIRSEHIFKINEYTILSVMNNLWLFCFENRNKNVRHIVQLEAWYEHHYIHVRLSDNGMGIDKKTIEQAFSPFYKINKSVSSNSLALFSVKKCLDFLHGSIDVHSELGYGCTFFIRVPIYAA